MISKKPAILLSYYNTLPNLYHCPSQSCTSCRYTRSTSSRQARDYAQHASSASAHEEEVDLSWPEAVHPHKSPTPYQILSVRQGELYSKHRFYSLVKLYHPDRCHPSSPVAHLPHSVRLERYRLLIAAHTILSDPAKRSAYDLWGQGWAGHGHKSSNRSPYDHLYRRSWPTGHDPMHNATWEDWERWHDREYWRESNREGDPQTVHMSNFGFLSLVFALISLGGIMQGTRANMFSSSVMEHRDKMHKEASMELARSKRATMSGNRSERIQTFLEHREAVHTGEDAYHRLLPAPETCSPDPSARRQ